MPHVTRPSRSSSTNGDQRSEFAAWTNATAVAWVLDEAPDLPAALVVTLIAVARYANPDGRNAYPRVEVVAQATRKSERQVKRDLAELRKLGLLIVGDQSAAARIPADRRPTVYDIPIWRTRGDAYVTPVAGRGDTDDTSRGDTDDRTGCHPWSDGVSSTTPKEEGRRREENLGKGKLRPRARQRGGAQQQQASQPKHIKTILDNTDATEDEAVPFATWLRNERNSDDRRLPGLINRLVADGDLQEKVNLWRTAQREDDEKAARSQFRKTIADEPPCSHGTPGGHIPMAGGWMACATQRNLNNLRTKPDALAKHLRKLEDLGKEDAADDIRHDLTEDELDALIEAEARLPKPVAPSPAPKKWRSVSDDRAAQALAAGARVQAMYDAQRLGATQAVGPT